MSARSDDGDALDVYEKCLALLDEGSLVAITLVTNTNEDSFGLFAVGKSLDDAPNLRASAYHANGQRRALAAFALVRLARQTAVKHDYKPLP